MNHSVTQRSRGSLRLAIVACLIILAAVFSKCVAPAAVIVVSPSEIDLGTVQPGSNGVVTVEFENRIRSRQHVTVDTIPLRGIAVDSEQLFVPEYGNASIGIEWNVPDDWISGPFAWNVVFKAPDGSAIPVQIRGICE